MKVRVLNEAFDNQQVSHWTNINGLLSILDNNALRGSKETRHLKQQHVTISTSRVGGGKKGDDSFLVYHNDIPKFVRDPTAVRIVLDLKKLRDNHAIDSYEYLNSNPYALAKGSKHYTGYGYSARGSNSSEFEMAIDLGQRVVKANIRINYEYAGYALINMNTCEIKQVFDKNNKELKPKKVDDKNTYELFPDDFYTLMLKKINYKSFENDEVEYLWVFNSEGKKVFSMHYTDFEDIITDENKLAKLFKDNKFIATVRFNKKERKILSVTDSKNNIVNEQNGKYEINGMKYTIKLDRKKDERLLSVIAKPDKGKTITVNSSDIQVDNSYYINNIKKYIVRVEFLNDFFNPHENFKKTYKLGKKKISVFEYIHNKLRTGDISSLNGRSLYYHHAIIDFEQYMKEIEKHIGKNKIKYFESNKLTSNIVASSKAEINKVIQENPDRMFIVKSDIKDNPLYLVRFNFKNKGTPTYGLVSTYNKGDINKIILSCHKDEKDNSTSTVDEKSIEVVSFNKIKDKNIKRWNDVDSDSLGSNGNILSTYDFIINNIKRLNPKSIKGMFINLYLKEPHIHCVNMVKIATVKGNTITINTQNTKQIKAETKKQRLY